MTKRNIIQGELILTEAGLRRMKSTPVLASMVYDACSGSDFGNGSTKKDAEKYANQYGITLINFTDDKTFGQIAMYTGSSSKLSNFTKEVFDNTIEDYIV